MYTIMLPLGLIVDTNVSLSIKAFGQLFEGLKLGINIDALLSELQPKFEKFYLGDYKDDQEFANDLLAAIKAKIPSDNKELNPLWEEVWQAEWREYWNLQCQITPYTIAVLEIILKNPDLTFVIFSETNPTHYSFITTELAKQGIAVEKLNIQTSFKAHQPIEKVMATFLQENEDAAHYKCTRLKENPNNVPNPLFQHLARAKEQRILQAMKKFDVWAVTISEPQLSARRLNMIISDIRRSLSPVDHAPAVQTKNTLSLTMQ